MYVLDARALEKRWRMAAVFRALEAIALSSENDAALLQLPRDSGDAVHSPSLRACG